MVPPRVCVTPTATLRTARQDTRVSPANGCAITGSARLGRCSFRAIRCVVNVVVAPAPVRRRDAAGQHNVRLPTAASTAAVRSRCAASAPRVDAPKPRREIATDMAALRKRVRCAPAPVAVNAARAATRAKMTMVGPANAGLSRDQTNASASCRRSVRVAPTVRMPPATSVRVGPPDPTQTTANA